MRVRRGRVLTLFQYALCAAAVVYLVHEVPWYSRVRLHGAEGPQVRLLENRGDSLVVEEDGRRREVKLSEAYAVSVGARRIPQVEIGLRDVALRLDRAWALGALLLFAPVVLLQSLRLMLLVHIQRVSLSFWNACKLTFAGNFFNFALPGTTGGDLIKAYYLSRYSHLKTEVVTTVFVDRLIGLAVLVFLGALGIGLVQDSGTSGVLVRWAAAGLGALSAGGAVLLHPGCRRRFRFQALAARLPAGNQLLRAGRAVLALWHDRTRLSAAFLATALMQGTCVLGAAVMARALGLHGPGGAAAQGIYFMAHVAVGFLVAAVPLTPQGVGVMEAAYIQFFARQGWNTASQAVAFALAVRLIQLVWALPGILVPLLGAHLPPAQVLRHLEGQD